jgi:hypothetical protein
MDRPGALRGRQPSCFLPLEGVVKAGRSEFKRPGLISAGARHGCSLVVQGKKVGKDLLLAHIRGPSIGGKDRGIERAVGQIESRKCCWAALRSDRLARCHLAMKSGGVMVRLTAGALGSVVQGRTDRDCGYCGTAGLSSRPRHAAAFSSLPQLS